MQCLSSASAVSALAVTTATRAQAPSPVLETDPQAQALGYTADSTKIEVKKHPNYAANQRCGTCVLFGGKTGDSSGSCTVFNNNLVASKGWCGAWTQRA